MTPLDSLCRTQWMCFECSPYNLQEKKGKRLSYTNQHNLLCCLHLSSIFLGGLTMQWADYFRSRTGKELCTNLTKYLTVISPLLPHVKNGFYYFYTNFISHIICISWWQSGSFKKIKFQKSILTFITLKHFMILKKVFRTACHSGTTQNVIMNLRSLYTHTHNLSRSKVHFKN